jgi:hypothetical protein
MTPYRIADRLFEPTSWIGVFVCIIGYAIPMLVPPTGWSHIAGCVQTLLGTAAFFLPENRMIVSGEEILKAVGAAVTPSYAASPAAVTLGDATVRNPPSPVERGTVGALLGLLILGGACALSACTTARWHVTGRPPTTPRPPACWRRAMPRRLRSPPRRRPRPACCAINSRSAAC